MKKTFKVLALCLSIVSCFSVTSLLGVKMVNAENYKTAVYTSSIVKQGSRGEMVKKIQQNTTLQVKCLTSNFVICLKGLLI